MSVSIYILSALIAKTSRTVCGLDNMSRDQVLGPVLFLFFFLSNVEFLQTEDTFQCFVKCQRI